MQGTKSDVRFLLLLLAVSLAGNVVLGYRLYAAPKAASQPTIAEFRKWFSEQPREGVPGNGSRSGRVEIVEFTDFQCPACARAYGSYGPVIRRLQAAHPGAIELQVRDFPLESECNAYVGQDMHPASCEAASAVRLARRDGKQDELVAWLYAHQDALTADAVWTAARSITGRSNLQADYATALAGVKEDVAVAHRLGVSGTPVFFINGVRMPSVPPDYFAAAMEQELAPPSSQRASVER